MSKKGACFKNLEGQKFGRWTVLRLHGYQKSSEKHIWWCRCDCGVEHPVRVDHLTENDGEIRFTPLPSVRRRMCRACSRKVHKALKKRIGK